MHETVNRALTTIALILGCVALIVFLVFAYRVQTAIDGVSGFLDSGDPVPTLDEDLPEECWDPGGGMVCAPGGFDGAPGGPEDVPAP